MDEHHNNEFDDLGGFDGSLEDLSDEELEELEQMEAERLEPVADQDEGGNWHVVIGVLVAAVALGWLVFDGLGSETYFFTVDEAVAAIEKNQSMVGEKMRVKGKVLEGTIVGEDGEIGRSFTISEKGRKLRVDYDRAVPDTFKEGAEVVATGTFTSEGKLQADEVLVKCPSRYEGKPPSEHPDNVPKG